MTRINAVVVALVAAAGLACSGGGNDVPTDTFVETLQGVWKTPCYNPGGQSDQRQTYTYSGTSRVLVTTTYPSLDGTCTGTGTAQPASSLTFTVGPTRTASLAGTSVTARDVDVTLETGAKRYLILYVDTSRVPWVMYGGDGAATRGLDGTTTAARPTVLEDWRPRVKEGGAAPADPILALLQGNWTACRAGTPDRGEINHVVGKTSTVTSVEYPSTDGSCSGAATLVETSTATFVVGANAPATLSGTPVVARNVDVAAPSGSQFNVVFVDTASEPDRILTGDLSADPARDGSAPAMRPVALAEPWARAAPLGDSTTTEAALQGAWAACYFEEGATGDRLELLTIDGGSARASSLLFASTDGACTGMGTPAGDTFAATVALGGTAPGTLLGTLVAAREVNVVADGPSRYTIMWVDTSTSPPALYTGDEIVNAYRDTTAPDRRPTVLEAWKRRVKTTPPTVTARSGARYDLTGTTWTSCDNGWPAAGQSYWHAWTFGLNTATIRHEVYTVSIDCTGPTDPAEHFQVDMSFEVTGGERTVGWDPAAPAGYPTTVAATGVTFAAPPSPLTAKGVVFVDDTRVPASIFVTNPGDPAPPADADGYPTVLSAGEHVRQCLIGPLVGQAAVAGLSIVEASPAVPERVTLAPNGSLIDGDVAASAGIDLGYGPTLAGDSAFRDMGFELPSATTAVDEVRVWVDRVLSPEASAAYVWNAFRSDDNLGWTPIALAGPARFDAVESRFDLPIARTEARYVKVGTRPLGAMTDARYASVLATEVRGFVAASTCGVP